MQNCGFTEENILKRSNQGFKAVQIAFIHPPETACLACLVAEGPPPEIFPILGATAGVLGCLEAMEALKYLTGTGELLEGRLLFFDGEAMQLQEVSFDKDPECRVCGSVGRG